MTGATYQKLLRHRVDGDYHRWMLVHLPSGKWAAVWHECFNDERRCEMILSESDEWFSEEPVAGGKANPTYTSRAGALQAIIEGFEEEFSHSPLMDDVFEPYIAQARRDLLNASASADAGTSTNGPRPVQLVSNTHDQVRRLYFAAKTLRNADNKSDVARLLNVSPQNLYVWEDRGISAEGLLNAQAAIGCDAIWLRDGSGEMVGGAEALKSATDDWAELVRLFSKADKDSRSMILSGAQAAIEVQERRLLGGSAR